CARGGDDYGYYYTHWQFDSW
nr:immunoglobulin heavy chain junction region [Macaca mulatta]MOW91254.1 immunoglobulin heavy chain junction region [Macaca mulatta]MOW91964.1 immunoglobulin heavy chain junction region [Macaca mulatta]